MAVNDYFQELMGRKAQAEVTGRTMSPEDVSAYGEAIIGGKTKAAYTGAQLGLQQQQLALNQESQKSQESIGKTQSIVSGVGALGQLGVGGSLAYKAYQGFNTGGAENLAQDPSSYISQGIPEGAPKAAFTGPEEMYSSATPASYTTTEAGGEVAAGGAATDTGTTSVSVGATTLGAEEAGKGEAEAGAEAVGKGAALA